MTNEEIIGQLEWVKKRICKIDYSPESFEAINSAIEAVKKQDEILENNKNLCKHCEELKEENKMLSDVKENLEKKVEFLMQQIRLWQKWESTVQEGKDCVENMNEQETFIDEERYQDEWTTRRKELQSLCDTCTKYNDCSESTKESPNYYICACRKYKESDKE